LFSATRLPESEIIPEDPSHFARNFSNKRLERYGPILASSLALFSGGEASSAFQQVPSAFLEREA
jgi:hypothetical protein